MRSTLQTTLSIFIALIILTSPAGAESNWASVDFRLLVILHPEMKQYDYSNERFFRSDFTKKDPGELRDELKKAKEKADELIGGLQEKFSRLSLHKNNLLVYKSQVVRELMAPEQSNPEVTKKRVELAFKNFAGLVQDKVSEKDLGVKGKKIHENPWERNQLIEEFSGKIDAQVASMETQIQDLSVQIEAVQETMYTPIYLTKDETNRKLKGIKDEITSLVKQVAKENGAQVVIDTTYGMQPIKPAKEYTNIPAQPDTPNLITAYLFQEFANLELINADGSLRDAEGNSLPQAHGMGAMIPNKISQFQKYLEMRNFMTQLAADFRPGRFFLIGGNELTCQVAEKLLGTYNVPKPMQETYLLLVQRYLSFEQDVTIPQDKFFSPKEMAPGEIPGNPETGP